MSKFASLKLLALVTLLALAAPAAAQSTDAHHDDNQVPQTLPAPAVNGMPGLGMTGPMGPMGGGGAQAPGMGGMMQMMQMMQSSQMMQMAQMMQMMQMMQQMQGGSMPGASMGMQSAPGGIMSGMTAPGGDVEQLIAGYKTALAITEAQQPQWNAFADALRAGAQEIRHARDKAAAGTAAPAQMERRAAVLEAEATALKQSQASAAALYNVLSPVQKQAADRLMADHLARM